MTTHTHSKGKPDTLLYQERALILDQTMPYIEGIRRNQRQA